MIDGHQAAAPTWEPTGDDVSEERFRLIAEKIQNDPSLLDIPLANIDRWLGNGHSAVVRLGQWRNILLAAKASPKGMRELVDLLCDQSGEAVFFKEFAPFPGVLTKEEVKHLRWTSAH